MKKIIHLILTTSVIASWLISTKIHASSNNSPLIWQDWSSEIFAQAKRENKFIILDLEAVWCHWCHVMDQKTYANPKVIKLLKEKYITVKVDQDSRPDLATRYQDYGWPATIFFAPDGTEIVKRAGYINPQAMTKLLQAIINDPSPEADSLRQPSNISKTSHLSTKLRQELKTRHKNTYDTKLGSLKISQKFIDRDSLEYALYLAASGEKQELKRARQTLDAAQALLDPVWGGIYQYSTQGDWSHPHFEKIMKSQTGYMIAYARAYKLLGDQRYLDTAKSIEHYLYNFLRDKNGAYYTSQDADIIQGQHSDSYFALNDVERRAIGIPRIDNNIYARENGWTIEALITLYETEHTKKYLERAITAANWILKNRSLENDFMGGFSHGKLTNNSQAFFGDNLAMARAMLALYRVTSDRQWLDYSIKTAKFIKNNFKHDAGGFISVAVEKDLKTSILKPIPQIDDNISVTRFYNLLGHYSGNKNHFNLAKHAMRYLATFEVATARITEAGILIADIELNQDPLHVTVVGKKSNQQSILLLNSGLELPFWYKRVELWDKSQGPLANDNVIYPQLSKTSAFVCTDTRCSLPLYNKKALTTLVNRTVLANFKLNSNIKNNKIKK